MIVFFNKGVCCYKVYFVKVKEGKRKNRLKEKMMKRRRDYFPQNLLRDEDGKERRGELKLKDKYCILGWKMFC